MASDAHRAAFVCLMRGRHRSAVSRAYFAVFAALTAALRERGMTPPAGRQSWAHATMPRILATGLGQHVNRQFLNNLSAGLRTLYRARVAADYHADDIVEADAAQRSVSLAEGFLRALEVPA